LTASVSDDKGGNMPETYLLLREEMIDQAYFVGVTPYNFSGK
jgi:hypothetical protein